MRPYDFQMDQSKPDSRKTKSILTLKDQKNDQEIWQTVRHQSNIPKIFDYSSRTIKSRRSDKVFQSILTANQKIVPTINTRQKIQRMRNSIKQLQNKNIQLIKKNTVVYHHLLQLNNYKIELLKIIQYYQSILQDHDSMTEKISLNHQEIEQMKNKIGNIYEQLSETKKSIAIIIEETKSNNVLNKEIQIQSAILKQYYCSIQAQFTQKKSNMQTLKLQLNPLLKDLSQNLMKYTIILEQIEIIGNKGVRMNRIVYFKKVKLDQFWAYMQIFTIIYMHASTLSLKQPYKALNKLTYSAPIVLSKNYYHYDKFYQMLSSLYSMWSQQIMNDSQVIEQQLCFKIQKEIYFRKKTQKWSKMIVQFQQQLQKIINLVLQMFQQINKHDSNYQSLEILQKNLKNQMFLSNIDQKSSYKLELIRN